MGFREALLEELQSKKEETITWKVKAKRGKVHVEYKIFQKFFISIRFFLSSNSFSSFFCTATTWFVSRSSNFCGETI